MEYYVRRRGPHTQHGKLAVSSNSTKHGILSRTLLRCRRYQCHYINICPIADEVGSIPHGAFCPVETANYPTVFSEYFTEFSTLPISDEERSKLAHDFTILEMQSIRCDGAAAVNGGSILKPVSDGPDTTNSREMEIIYRYRRELLDRRIELTRKFYSMREAYDEKQ